MTGTNPLASFGQTNFTTQTATVYKTQIDSNSIVMQRIVDCFAPRQSNTPAMTVTLDPGYIFRGTTLTELAAQTTGTITAPTGNPRIDRVVVDKLTGAVSVVTGTPAASPVPPAIPSGKAPVCQVLLQTTSSTITNAMLTDERVIQALGRGAIAEEGIGVWLKDDGAGNLTLNVNASLRDDGTGKLTTSLTTEAAKTAAATTDLGTMASNIGVINGNTTITSFGNSASTANPLYVMRVAGTPLLTNSTNLILPGGANYQCAAGDLLFCKFEGSSKWRIGILTASGEPVIPISTATVHKQVITTSGNFTAPAGTLPTTSFTFRGTGAGAGGGGGTTPGTAAGGGGAGATFEVTVSGLVAGTNYPVVIGLSGPGSSSSTGTVGGDTTLTIGATTYTAGGGKGGNGNATACLGGLGGTATGGAMNLPGGDGASSANPFNVGLGGHGGDSIWGGGGRGAITGTGADGRAYGSGGGGGAQNSAVGGNGANGLLVAEYVL